MNSVEELAAELASQLQELRARLASAQTASYNHEVPEDRRLRALSAAVAVAGGHLDYLIDIQSSPLNQLGRAL